MGKFVLVGNGFTVEVYDIDHPPPHCHVRRTESSSVVNLPTLKIRHGRQLSADEKKFLIMHLDQLCEEFDKRTPKREDRTEKKNTRQ